MFARIRYAANAIADKSATALHHIGKAAAVIGGGYHALAALARAAASNNAIAQMAATGNSSMAEITTAATTHAKAAATSVNVEVAVLSAGVAIGTVANIIRTINQAKQNSRVANTLARFFTPNDSEMGNPMDTLPEELRDTAMRTKVERAGFGLGVVGGITLAVIGGMFILANPVTGAVLLFTSDLTFYGATSLLDASYQNEAARLAALEQKLEQSRRPGLPQIAASAPPAYVPGSLVPNSAFDASRQATEQQHLLQQQQRDGTYSTFGKP